MKNEFRVRRAVLPIAAALALLTSIASIHGQPATTQGAATASAGVDPAPRAGPNTPTRPDSPPGSTPRAPDTQLAYSLEALSSRLQSLETLQEASVSLSQGVLGQMSLVLQISAGVLGIFFVGFSLRQVFADR